MNETPTSSPEKPDAENNQTPAGSCASPCSAFQAWITEQDKTVDWDNLSPTDCMKMAWDAARDMPRIDRLRLILDDCQSADLTSKKTEMVLERGSYRGDYQIAGFVLCNPGGHRCVIDSSAVRWLDRDEMWWLMHDSKSPINFPNHKMTVGSGVSPCSQCVPAHYAGSVTLWDLERCMRSSGNAFVDARRTDAIEYAFRIKDDLLGDLIKARHCLDEAIKVLSANARAQATPPITTNK